LNFWLFSFRSSSVNDVNYRVGFLILLSVPGLGHFVFGFGEGEAAVDGLAAGLGLVTGAVPVALAGEGAVAGDDVAPLGDDVVVGGVELFSGSAAQPTANAIARTIGSRRLMRVIRFIFGLLIVLPRVSTKIEKQAHTRPRASFQQWVFPQSFTGLAHTALQRNPHLKTVVARLANAGWVVCSRRIDYDQPHNAMTCSLLPK
jgi:hypothetical protein